MAFIRTKTVKGRQYEYLVESYRDEHGKVKQKTLKYLGAVKKAMARFEKEDLSSKKTPSKPMVTHQLRKITFEEYLSYDDGTDSRYELVDGELILMPPATARHSDIIDFIADCFKAIAREYKLDIKIKTGDVGVRTGMNSSRIPDVSVVDGEVWRNLPRDVSAVIQTSLMLAVEVVSPGTEQIERDYTDKAIEYQNTGIPEYWIVDPIKQKITILILDKGNYTKTVFTGSEAIASVTFPQLKLTATEILEA
jgi:Uma2 family endonuclease